MGPQRQFLENICSEEDLRSRIFGTFVVKFIASLFLLGFSNIQKNGINNFIMIIETFNTAINAHLKLLSSSVTCASYDIC